MFVEFKIPEGQLTSININSISTIHSTRNKNLTTIVLNCGDESWIEVGHPYVEVLNLIKEAQEFALLRMSKLMHTVKT